MLLQKMFQFKMYLFLISFQPDNIKKYTNLKVWHMLNTFWTNLTDVTNIKVGELKIFICLISSHCDLAKVIYIIFGIIYSIKFLIQKLRSENIACLTISRSHWANNSCLRGNSLKLVKSTTKFHNGGGGGRGGGVTM